MALLLQIHPCKRAQHSAVGVCKFRILEAAFMAPQIKRFIREAPRIARKICAEIPRVERSSTG